MFDHFYRRRRNVYLVICPITLILPTKNAWVVHWVKNLISQQEPVYELNVVRIKFMLIKKVLVSVRTHLWNILLSRVAYVHFVQKANTRLMVLAIIAPTEDIIIIPRKSAFVIKPTTSSGININALNVITLSIGIIRI